MIAQSCAADYDSRIQPHRVHRSVYVDPDIFKVELERIFERTWIFLGHDSQVTQPGDFYATRIGRHPVLILRDTAGQIRAFFNRCLHKGSQLVLDGAGKAKANVIRCNYHGWTYALNGELRTVPAQEAYPPGTVRAKCEGFGLRPVPDVDQYRGFVFGRLCKSGPGLAEWLGPLRSSLDNFIDRSPEGRIEVAGGVLRYAHQCNWKFFLENTLDALHPMVVHLSAAQACRDVTAAHQIGTNPAPFELQALMPFAGSYKFYDDMGARVMAHGHADLGGNASLHSGYDIDPAYLQAMHHAYGEERTRQIIGLSRNNSVAYPSLMFKAPIQLLRVVRPLSVDRTLIETWHFRLCGAPESLLARTVAYSTLINSSAGMVGPDDHQIYRDLQAGLGASQVEWIELSRYPNTHEEPDGEATKVRGTSDAMHRGQFAEWLEMMRV